MTPSRTPVTAHSADPLTRAGLRDLLRLAPGVELLDRPDGREGAVAVLAVARMTEATTPTLRELTRERPVVLVVEQLREHELAEVVGCGVRTVLWRADTTPAALGGAVRAAARGESRVPADLLGRLLAQVSGTAAEPGTPAVGAGLARREADVLRLVADGFDTQEIAGKLSYSERTVKNVLYGFMRRLQLRNRAHAVAFALREGYI
jgi:DNA-binding NarL/FixJ family response regulator